MYRFIIRKILQNNNKNKINISNDNKNNKIIPYELSKTND